MDGNFASPINDQVKNKDTSRQTLNYEILLSPLGDIYGTEVTGSLELLG